MDEKNNTYYNIQDSFMIIYQQKETEGLSSTIKGHLQNIAKSHLMVKTEGIPPMD